MNTNRWIQLVVAGVALLVSTLISAASDVSMTTGDGFNEHSFDTSGHWSSAAAPTSGNNYFTTFILRSPTTGSAYTFAGDSLTLSPGGALYQKVNPLTLTVNNLTNDGRVVNAQGGTFTIAGTMFVPTNSGGGQIDHGSGNSSGTDNRTIIVASTVTGTGNMTNWTSDANWPNNSTAQGTVQYTGNNSGFTGRQIITRNTIVSIASLSNLGGNPAAFTADQLTFNNGILRPAGSFALNNANGGTTIAAGGGSIDVGAGILFTNGTALAGSGTLILTNSGTLVEGAGSSALNFTGTITINKGTLLLDSAGSFAGTNTLNIGAAGTFDVTAAGITLANGQTLAGSGTVLGTVTSATGSKISPGGSGSAANLSIANVAFTGGGSLLCDFTGTTNDVVMVSGNVSASGVTSVQLVNVPAANGTYTIMAVTGTLGGSAANFHVNALSTRTKNFSVSYDTASTPKRVLLIVSGSGSPGNLVWAGDTVSNFWDIATSSNWLNGVTADVYFDGDTNNFTDYGASNQPILNVTVNPAAVNFNTASNYNLTGIGALAGLATLYKGGTGAVTISTTNSYSGGTVVSNGVLTMGTIKALGTPAGSTPLASVTGTGTLDINGMAIDSNYTNTVQISGTGSSASRGAIDNAIGGLTSGTGDIGIGTLALTGNATISAAANWQIGLTGSGIVGNGFTLTKTGNNYLYLRHSAASALGGLTIVGPGGVLFWDRADAAGATASITLTNGGFIDTWNPGNNFNGLTFNNPIVVNDAVNGGYIMSIRNPTFNHPGYDIYNGSVTLANGNLIVSNVTFLAGPPQTFGRITLNGNISGQGGITAIGGISHFLGTGAPEFYGGNLVTLNGNNSYSGPTLVSNLVQLLISTANQSGGNYDVVDYATLDVSVAAGQPTIPMNNLILEQVNQGPANLGFTRLATMPTSPVVYATNLNINAGVILPPTAGYTVGQFPLIKYNGSIGGSGFGGLSLGTLPAGVTASLVDNSVNHTIDLLVTAAGITWTGANSTNWDTSTVNWFNPVSSSATTYADGQTVVFNDSGATNPLVNIVQAIQPGGITVNSSSNYTFSAPVVNGIGIAGSGALIKNGSGTLFITASNNTFTGGTIINGGTIKLGDSNFVFPYGGGALNNNLGNVTIANGGTLDINAVQVPNFQSFGPEGYNVFVSGTGVGGNGALVNNSTNNNDLADPGYVTLTGDATVGGAGDINIRHGVSPQMSSQSGNYTLTKVGTGQFRIRYVTTISTNFGPIKILQGNLTYESTSQLGLGDANKTITVGSGGGFGWGTVAAQCVRPLVCSNTATILGLNSVSNVFNGAVTLVSGNVNLNANFYNGMIFSNVLSGAGGVTVLAQSRVTFAASNTYSGNTIVADCNAANGGDSGSILKLTGVGSINNSPSISIQGITPSQAFPGAIDASGRADGTLTLLSTQTLRGDNGSWIKGNVLASSGAIITPGGATNLQYMTFSNNLTLSSGTVVMMDVSMDGGNGATNDLIRTVGTNTFAGTLVITNIGATALTNGAAFKLFSGTTNLSNFATVSGTPGGGGTWSFNPTNGVATATGITGGVATNPTNILVSATSTSLTLSWPSDHLGWTLQSQTNSASTGIGTNWYDVIGSSASTQAVITINPTLPAVFFRLRQ